MDAPRGTILVYATAPGSVASDGAGRNGIYTKHLLAHMREPGLPIEQVLKRVRINVMQETDNMQVPWESSSLTGDFYFVKTASLSPAAREQLTGHLSIRSNITGASVLIDGDPIGFSPLQNVEIDPGKHQVPGDQKRGINPINRTSRWKAAVRWLFS